MTTTKTKNPLQREFGTFWRDGPTGSARVEGEQRLVDAVWTKGAVVRRRVYDWWNDEYVVFDEQLSLEAGDVDMARLSSGRAPLLDTHSAWNVRDSLLGVVKSAEIKNGEGIATLQISSRDDLAGFWRDVQDGIVANVSVGYDVTEWEIHQREGQPDLWIARKWIPMELSFVPMGADPDAGTKREAAQGDRRVRCKITYLNRASPDNHPRREKSMKDENTRGAGKEPASTTTVDDNNVVDLDATRKAAADEAVKTERKRVSEIRTAVRDFGFEDKEADTFINDGKTIDEVRAALQAKLAARSTETRQRPHVQPGNQDEVSTRRRLAENALAHRAGPGRVKLEDGARQFRGLTLIEFAREYLRQEGIDTRGLERMEVSALALGMTRAAGMHTTSDFPLILANVASKRLREVYESRKGNWKLFSRQANFPDFKSRSVVQLSEAPRLERVPEHGEYKYGKLTEDGISYALATYGKIIAITRQAIINDDLGAFDRIPTLFGRAAADMEGDMVWGIITSNPNMSDGNALFHASHGNLASPAAALDVGPLGVARAAMRKQKNIGGLETINVEAAYLLVPAELETKAEQIIAQNLIPSQTTNVVPEWFRSLTPIVEPRLSVNSATAWYLAADPQACDFIEYGYLEGQEGVYTETRMGFEVDGVEIKVREDFAAKAVEWRGAYKNAGA